MRYLRGGFGPLVLLVCLSVISEVASAQRTSRYWFFGNKTGLDFHYEPPRPIESAIETFEGCANAFTSDGRLLFYTNGEIVWNSEHEIMENGAGLAGHISSAQSSLIIPFPDDSTRYYLFTTDNEGYVDTPVVGLSYSVIDLSYNEGKGKIIRKNVNLLSNCSERLAGVLHCNERDYWVIARTVKEFYVYRITRLGIDSPFVSTIGLEEIPVPQWERSFIGCLKVSPDRTRIAMMGRSTPGVQLFQFNPSTGLINNFLFIDLNIGGYGCSFSPNSQVLYTSSTFYLFQLSLYSNDSLLIRNSLFPLDTIIGIHQDYRFGGLQLGPDNKMYVSTFGPWVARIDQPDSLGFASNYSDSSINLKRYNEYSFPNFIDAIGTPSKCSPPVAVVSAIDTICEGECIELVERSTGDVPWVSWSITRNKEVVATSEQRSFSFCQTKPGQYNVEFIASNSGGADTIRRSVYVLPSLSTTEVTLMLDHQQVYPGDTVTYKLASDILSHLPEGTSLKVSLEFDSSILAPVDSGWLHDGRISITLSSSDTTIIRFIARRGSSDSTSVTFRNVHWVNACPAIVKTIDGSIKLKVKQDGGIYVQDGKKTSIVPYPNPAFGRLRVMIDLAREGETLLQIADEAGRVVARIDQQLILGKNWFELDLPGLSAGVYTITLKSNQEYTSKSFTLLR